MPETKPTYSKGALRAAEKIYDLLEDCGSSEIANSTIGTTPFWKELAQIIYKETRQDDWQELLRAAEDVADELSCQPRTNALATYNIRLQAAIRRVEGE